MSILLKSAIRMKGWIATAAFERLIRDPRKAQAQLLRAILRTNADTDYGRKHGFFGLRTHGALARAVPVNTYEDITPYVERIKAGRRRVLTAEQPAMFALTSGTTNEPKLIPVTQRGMMLSANVSRRWLFGALRDHPACLDRAVLCVSGRAIEGRTPTGIPYGSASGMLCRGLPKSLQRSFALPPLVSELGDHDLRYYLMARISMEKDISFVATPNPSTLMRIAETGIRYQEQIVQSIHDGVIAKDCHLNASVADTRTLDAISAQLTPNAPRASALEHAIHREGRLTPSACWRNMKLIGCWLGGSVGYHADRLTPYFGDAAPRRDLGFLASEGSFTAPAEDNTPAGILALDTAYYEFIPETEWSGDAPPTLGCHELEQGKRYRMILTNWNGLYRYDIHDIVEVRGFHNRVPIIAFVRKTEDMLNITGEKVHVNHFLAAFQEVRAAHNLSITEFRAVPNHDAMRYELLVHVSPLPSRDFLRGTILPSIDASLSEANIEYAHKRQSRRLNLPCLHLMDDRWADDVRRHALVNGRPDTQFKWRVVAPQLSPVDVSHIRETVSVWDMNHA